MGTLVFIYFYAAVVLTKSPFTKVCSINKVKLKNFKNMHEYQISFLRSIKDEVIQEKRGPHPVNKLTIISN